MNHTTTGPGNGAVVTGAQSLISSLEAAGTQHVLIGRAHV